MSDPRAQTARRLYAALTAGDRDTLDLLLHPDFVGHAADGLPLGAGGVHDGPAAMRRNLWGMIARHYVAAAEAESMTGLDDGGLLVRGHYRGHARVSGRALDAEFMHVLRFADDGRILGLDQLTDTAAWVQALGSDGPLATVHYTVADGVATIDLAIEPPVVPGQRAALILGEREIVAEPFGAATSALRFRAGGLPPGQPLLARLRVDGIDSAVLDRSVSPPRFLDRRITIT